jgi:hypothetical protein
MVSLETLPGQNEPNAQTHIPSVADTLPTDTTTPAPPKQVAQPAAVTGPGMDGLEPTFAQKIKAMIAASHGRLYIESGYRSDAQQSQLYDAAVQKYGAAGAGKWVAPPGHSNHNKGLAVDLGGDIGLAHQLAAQFGLEFPMSWEPWHIEPVGLREQPATPATAYTAGPPGSINPTQDPTLNYQPANLLAKLSNALQGPTATGVAAEGFVGTDPNAAATGGTAGASGVGGSTATGAANYTTTPGQGQAGAVKPADLYKMLTAQGVDPVHAAALVAIAGRESGYNPAAHNGNAGTGDNSYGLFQINLLNGMHSQFSPEMLSTAEGSAQAAAQLVKGGGLSA